MSFSSEVKEELSRQFQKSRHCQIAEIAAILSFAGKLEEESVLRVYTENLSLARKYFMLMKKTFHADVKIAVRQSRYLHKSRIFVISLLRADEVKLVLQAVKWQNEKGEPIYRESLADGRLVQNGCCRRAFIRGAFFKCRFHERPGKVLSF